MYRVSSELVKHEWKFGRTRNAGSSSHKLPQVYYDDLYNNLNDTKKITFVIIYFLWKALLNKSKAKRQNNN